MAYRNKTYIAFDADTDMWAYRYMRGWKAADHIEFDFHDAHDINDIKGDSSEATIKRRLRERLYNAKLLLVLVGEKTKNLHRFVRWEQDVALEMGIPIVAVYLNGSNSLDVNTCPPVIRDEFVLHIPYKLATCRWAIDNWPEEYRIRKRAGASGAFSINANTLNQLLRG